MNIRFAGLERQFTVKLPQNVLDVIRAGHPPTSSSARNPFKPGSLLAKQFDGMLQAYASGHRDLLREQGTVRCMGNGWADNFWLGYDGCAPTRVPKGTLAWACYRAGQRQRTLDNRRGVFVPVKTNSRVPRAGAPGVSATND